MYNDRTVGHAFVSGDVLGRGRDWIGRSPSACWVMKAKFIRPAVLVRMNYSANQTLCVILSLVHLTFISGLT